MLAFLVSHTHWDREWYLTQEEFRIKLVRLVDELLDDGQRGDTAPFMLDGQTKVLDDYCEVKPYRKKELVAAIQSNQIVCGPWYILPDELLLSGEGHIRNFLIGQHALAEYGSSMRVAYLPDSFGHPAQMPQIIHGLGMDTMVFWRGTSNHIEKTEFYWQSPHAKAQILCVHLPHGYGNSARLNPDMQETIPRLQHLLQSLEGKSTTDVVLLMNGSDHITAQKDLLRVVKKIQQELPDIQFIPSTLQEFVQKLKSHLPGSLATVQGEMRSGERSMLLGGTLSTRMPLKQQNERALTLAERYLEPLLACEALLGSTYDSKGYIEYLWKKILENQPHDSICGCSIDTVHREMSTRYEQIQQIEAMLLGDAARRIAQKQNNCTQDNQYKTYLFEPTQDALPCYIEVEANLERMLIQNVNFTRSIIEDFEAEIEHPDLPHDVIVRDENGRTIPHVILSMEKSNEHYYQDETMPEIYKTNRVKLGLLLPGLPIGLHTLSIERCEGIGNRPVSLGDTSIENKFYHICVQDGEIIVLDKKSGKTHTGVAKLIDGGDAGDEYTYSWPKQDSVIYADAKSIEISCIELPGIGQRMHLKGVLRLPASLTQDRISRSQTVVECPFATTISLYHLVDLIAFEVAFENHALDHRLQVQFPSGIYTEQSNSYNTFHVAQRPVTAPVPDEWMEYPQNTHPTHGFMNLEDATGGISASAVGLPEFEAVQLQDQTALNITLLRSVGWLSRTDLLTRKGNGGWTIATPEAQCLGKHTFSFGIGYHQGSWKTNNAFATIERHRLQPYILPIPSAERFALQSQNPLSFLHQLPQNIRLSTVKLAEARDGLVVRVFNVAYTHTVCTLNIPSSVQSAAICNMAEEWQHELSVTDGAITFNVQEHQITTLYFRF